MRPILVLAFALLLTASTALGQASGPKAVVMAFYRFDAANSQVFNRANIDARRRWLSEELYKLLINELERERAYLAENPTDKPHFGDGLPFQPLDEPCELNGRQYRRTISYGTVTVKSDLANVDVFFKYPKGCSIPDVLYVVNMSRERGRWVIDDIRYLKENTSLVEVLDRIEY
ncbi:MAG TPA: hypothetical protein VFZ49_03145 [Pyrinomonadaceae bacterium]